jgi:ubiquinone/menaquinone biosynthesis C-methylase UbiE
MMMTETGTQPSDARKPDAGVECPEPGYIGDLFDELADDYDELHRDVGWDPWPHVKAALGIGPLTGKRVLDVGCGTGQVAADLVARGASVICLDASPRMCELAAQRVPGMHCVVHALGERPLPFRDDTFDVVVALGCVEFASDPAAACAELVRVVRPGGSALWVAELCGDDCAEGSRRTVELYEEWRRYRLTQPEAIELAKNLLVGVTNVRVPGYVHDDTGERIVYMRTIGQKPGTTLDAA